MFAFFHSLFLTFGFIGWLFVVLTAIGLAINGKQCASAYISEIDGTQNAAEYK